MAFGKVGISTHVLDTARGAPACNLPVRLEARQASGKWRAVGSAQTGKDGRCSNLISDDGKIAPGTYRLIFDTKQYFTTQGVESLYPVIEVTFSVREADMQYHLPLLLSPNGYTTYRGS
jgi:5-hydroxyisourate hydrolase